MELNFSGLSAPATGTLLNSIAGVTELLPALGERQPADRMRTPARPVSRLAGLDEQKNLIPHLGTRNDVVVSRDLEILVVMLSSIKS